MRTTIKTLVTLALAGTFMLSGCGTEEAGDDDDDGPEKLRDDIPDPPEGGVQLVSPIFEVEAGKELFVCFQIDFEVTEDMYVTNSDVYQMTNGHHTFVYFTDGDAPGLDPNPHECDGLDMNNVRVAASGSADGGNFFIADDVALKIPKGVKLWAQSHYINATDQKRQVQDVVNLTLADPNEVAHTASTFAQLDLTFELPPGETTTSVLNCKPHEEFYVPWFLPHMHEWGTNYKIEVLDGNDEIVFSTEGAWSEGQRNDFQVEELDEHLLVTPDHTIRTTCEWFNTENEMMLFPQEMCVTFFPFYPGDGSLWACDENGDVFRP